MHTHVKKSIWSNDLLKLESCNIECRNIFFRSYVIRNKEKDVVPLPLHNHEGIYNKIIMLSVMNATY